MGTIVSRRRKDGTLGHTAQIRIKQDGRLVHSETQTFDRKPAAQAWLNKREAELAQPGALHKPADPLLRDVITTYNADNARPHGATKTQVLRTIAASTLGDLRCSQVTSQEIVKFAQGIDATPGTRANYISHLAAVVAVARPAWGYPLSQQALDDARTVLTRLGITGRSRSRTRRPTLEELDQLLRFYADAEKRRSNILPMTRIITFAIFSTRRQEEITRITLADLDRANMEQTVRDMKNPGEKTGNDVATTLTPEALRLIDVQTKAAGIEDGATIWPYNSDSISTSFTRTCQILGIEDLHFHDLRHDGISRLFELGWNIPRVACVSGHRTWASLKRYTHLRQVGDKYAGWPWLERLGIATTPAPPPDAKKPTEPP